MTKKALVALIEVESGGTKEVDVSTFQKVDLAKLEID